MSDKTEQLYRSWYRTDVDFGLNFDNQVKNLSMKQCQTKSNIIQGVYSPFPSLTFERKLKDKYPFGDRYKTENYSFWVK